jgi:hypothetical protein
MRRLLKNLFGTKTAATAPRRTRLNVEGLEQRDNPSSYVQFGTLYIVGTDTADTVTVHYGPGSAGGYYGGIYFYPQPPALEVRENGTVTAHPLYSNYTWGGSPISRIEFNGRGGDDYFNDYSNRVPVTASGMGGNDTLIGYGHDDYLYGGADNDELYGYGGRDFLWGDDGRDVLHGQGGDDTVYGNNHDDQLYGGSGRDFLSGGAGLDVLDGGADFDSYNDDFDFTQPFYLGQAVTDVIQQDALTCQTLAAMASATAAGHYFVNQITYLGNHNYQVRVFPNGVATNVTVRFDGNWSDNDPAPARDSLGRTLPEFWTILLQRTRLQLYGLNWQTEQTPAQWNTVLNTGNFRMSWDAMQTLTGLGVTQSLSIPAPATLQNQIANGRMVQVATPPTLPAGAPVRANHVFTVTTVWQDAGGAWWVYVYDPYGFYQLLSWGQFTANFVETAVA